jgi:hypothetical protein
LAELHCTDAEMQALEARFANDMGVNYIAFLDALDPPEHRPLLFVQRVNDLRAANARQSVPECESSGSLESVLLKVKTKASLQLNGLEAAT